MTRTIGVFGLLSILIAGSAALASLAFAETGASTGAAACFYGRDDFRGASFCTNEDRAALGPRWDDRIQSVRVSPGYKVTLFRDARFRGDPVRLVADERSLTNRFLGRAVSSFKISEYRDTEPPTVFDLRTSSANANNWVVDEAGPLTFFVGADDNVGVTRVEFWREDEKLGEDFAAPYETTIDLTSADNGQAYIVARAYDAAGNQDIAVRTLTVVIDGAGSSPGTPSR